MKEFEYTPAGYLKAKKWLTKIGEFDRLNKSGFSTDGYSIVQAANVLLGRWEIRIPPNTTVTIKSGDKLFNSVIEKVEWDLDQWSYLINGNWYCQSEVSI
jgi:hypothetical protein